MGASPRDGTLLYSRLAEVSSSSTGARPQSGLLSPLLYSRLAEGSSSSTGASPRDGLFQTSPPSGGAPPPPREQALGTASIDKPPSAKRGVTRTGRACFVGWRLAAGGGHACVGRRGDIRCGVHRRLSGKVLRQFAPAQVVHQLARVLGLHSESRTIDEESPARHAWRTWPCLAWSCLHGFPHLVLECASACTPTIRSDSSQIVLNWVTFRVALFVS